MSEYNKVTYCRNCGASNNWSFSKGSSLLEKPELCRSCHCDLTTGKKTKKKIKAKTPKKEEPKEVVPNFKDLPPLELDEDACVFSKEDRQPLGGLVSPVFKEDELESPTTTNVNQES
tara:strand:+ start:607 stop:957 length:351 start_codon:yes stop_codon:yes gene_type:complete